MTHDDIIRMAREADMGFDFTAPGLIAELERFAHLVYESVFRDANIAASRTILDAAVLAEREACAKVCETYEVASIKNDAHNTAKIFNHCAAAIRARGQA